MILEGNNDAKDIQAKAREALDLLTDADEAATELSRRGGFDYKKASAMATYFLRVLMPLRELIEYLENEATRAQG